ncbi:MAG TPA: ComF family protein [Micromonosporaceae bacterium]|jgi:predicted amidophosphoribosyltransferase|nr:ComF family protein [Micromonosporaceae bacterium]
MTPDQLVPSPHRLLAGLRDLLLPVRCAGCRREAMGSLCGDCAAALASAGPRQVRPDPAPPGLPPCHAAGRYGGRFRELILSYKDRGRYGLARPLADVLAMAVVAAVPTSHAVLLAPVPTAPRAVRERRGDHMLWLARATLDRLRRDGRTAAVVRPVRAVSRPDSAGLSAAERHRMARASLRPRRGRGTRRPLAIGASLEGPSALVVLDDVITTGATIAAMSGVLAGMNLRVDAAVVLAATERRWRPRAHRV